MKIREGVPVTDLAAQLGHARKSLTLVNPILATTLASFRGSVL